MPLTLFHQLSPNQVGKTEKEAEQGPNPSQAPPMEALTRRHALVPEEKRQFFEDQEEENGDLNRSPCDNVIIVPHMQISPGDMHLYNRAISGGRGILAELQRATVAAQAFYSETGDDKKAKPPWILKRLYEWSHRAKSREISRHAQKALSHSDQEYEDEQLRKLIKETWHDLFPMVYEYSVVEQKRLKSVWELLYTESVFLYQHLLTLRNVFKEPLKECQVEGCLLFVEPDLLFGNLDELCQISYSFCKEFHNLVIESVEAGQYAPTQVVVKLFDKFSKGPSTISAYQAYCINYKATIEYLDSVRQKDDRFIEFERVCIQDARCQRLQLEDLLIAPLHRITRLPLLLREIWKYTEDTFEKEQIEFLLQTLQEALKSIDESIQWLHNFERIQELQAQLVWPPVMELEPRTFVPDFLKLALSRQFCENLVAHPRRKLVCEGVLYSVENQKTVEYYAFLFNDMLLLTKAKKGLNKSKSGASERIRPPPRKQGVVGLQKGVGQQRPSTDTGFSNQRYMVIKQPVPLDSCVFCDIGPHDASAGHLRHAFVIIHLTRFYQVVSVYTLQAPNKEEKDGWITKFQESIENYESVQLKDMLKCTPLLNNPSMKSVANSRRSSRECSVQTVSEEISASTPSLAQSQNRLSVPNLDELL